MGITLAKWLWIYGGDKFLKPEAHKNFHRRKPTTYYYFYGVGGCCDDLSLHCMYASIEVGGEELVAPPCPVLVRAFEEPLYVRLATPRC